MKAVTYLAAFALSASALVSQAFAEPLKGWVADLDQALAQAKAEHKAVLVEFTGSDWCPPCKMMRAGVFSKPEFVAAASKKFILVEIDMPKADAELTKKNQPTVEKYKIDGFPTVLLLEASGREFSRFYASKYPKTEDFLKHLAAELDKKDLD
ncbi:MAG: thioredoxin fold domain-containing protein [Verrucomicrobia bacterium]|nr:MAG: thioredoxin fold domain-containing protein [Verrucomicrobiota bacterium]